MTPDDFLAYVQSGGALAAFFLFISGLMRKWWVMGTEHRALEDRLRAQEQTTNEWKQMAISGTVIAEQSVRVAREAREDHA